MNLKRRELETNGIKIFLEYQWIYCWILFSFSVLWLLLPASYPRFFIYLLPFLLVSLYLWSKKKPIFSSSVIIFIFFNLFALFMLFLNQEISLSNLRDLALISLGILPYLLRLTFKRKQLLFLFISLSILGLIDVFVRFEQIDRWDFVKSISPFESNISLVIGAFSGSIALYPSRFRRLIPLLITILFFKRIAIFGAAIIYFLSLLNIKRSFQKIVAIALIITGMLFSLSQVEIYNTLSKSNINIDAFTMGRYNLSKVFLDEISTMKPLNILFGKGVGSSRLLALEATNGKLDLPHSDYLRLIYEFGFIGTLLYVFIIYKSLSNLPNGRFVMMYLSILFITENILIYPVYHWVYNMITQSSED